MIRYVHSADAVTIRQLDGFFEGWLTRPTAEDHLRLLKASYRVVLAIDDETDTVVGFITAISDGVLSAYIPLLEVRSDYRGHGIGSALTREMLSQLAHLYMVDVLCDPELQGFYERLGLHRADGMMLRNFT